MKLERQPSSHYTIPGSKPQPKGQPELEMLDATLRDLTAEAGVDSSPSIQERPLQDGEFKDIMQRRILWFGRHLEDVRKDPSGRAA